MKLTLYLTIVLSRRHTTLSATHCCATAIKLYPHPGAWQACKVVTVLLIRLLENNETKLLLQAATIFSTRLNPLTLWAPIRVPGLNPISSQVECSTSRLRSGWMNRWTPFYRGMKRRLYESSHSAKWRQSNLNEDLYRKGSTVKRSETKGSETKRSKPKLS